MTPEQEDNMRKQISDYSKGEFIELAIQLQNTVDHNVTKIRGLESSQEQMGKQIPALRDRVEQLEEELESAGETKVDSEELTALQTAHDALKAKYDRLETKHEELQDINQKLQLKLIGD